MALLMTCACFSALYGADEPENLLEDPSFEEARANALGAWKMRGPEFAKVSLDRKDLVEGEQSLSIEVPDPGGPTIAVYQDPFGIVLEADTKYTLSCWMRSSQPGYVSLKVEAADLGGANKPLTQWGMKRVIVKPEWEEYYLTCTAKEFTEKPKTEFRLGAIADLWIDQTRLYEGEFVPSKGPKGSHSVRSQGKLAITWGGIRKR